MSILNSLKRAIVWESKHNGLSVNILLVIALIPLVIVFFYGGLLTIPITRTLAIWGLQENRPVELITFLFSIAGGIQGLILMWRLRKDKRSRLAFWFYLFFALGLLFVAGEEVAWGQWFWGFETPTALENVNAQGELTLHNVGSLHDRLEIFPLTFGISGLIGVLLNQSRSFRQLGASYVLLSWFAIIALVSAIDMFHDFVVIQEQFDHLINHLDEVIEMLVAIAGFLYIWLNQQKLTWQWKTK